MQSYYFKIIRSVTVATITAGMLLLPLQPILAVSEVPVHDADLIDAAKKTLEQATKTATAQVKATANQLFAWRNTYNVTRLKKEILDIFSEKIFAYTQNPYATDNQDPGPLFVTNWVSYLKTAYAKGREYEIRAIEFEAKNQYFCFAPQVITLLRNPKATVSNDDPNCILPGPTNSAVTSFNDYQNNDPELFTEICPDQPEFAIVETPETCGTPYYSAISGIFAPERGLTAGAGQAYFERRLNDTYAAYKQRVDSAGSLAQRAAEDEALAGNGFLSAKNIQNQPDPRDPTQKITPDDPANPNAPITIPGYIMARLAGDAASLDLQYIANADQLDKDALQIITDSFITKLTTIDNPGFTSAVICEHAQARADRDAKANNTAPVKVDCTTIVPSDGATEAIADGKTDTTIPDDANELIAKLNELLAIRGTSENLFKETIKAAKDYKAKFDKGGSLDPQRTCRTAAEIASHSRSFTKADGTKGWRPCMTQDDFDKYGDFQTAIEDNRNLNSEAVRRLNAFKRDVMDLDPTAGSYPAEVIKKLSEFATLSILGSGATPSCNSTAGGNSPYYNPGDKPNPGPQYYPASDLWTPSCYEYSFSESAAQQEQNAIRADYNRVREPDLDL